MQCSLICKMAVGVYKVLNEDISRILLEEYEAENPSLYEKNTTVFTKY